MQDGLVLAKLISEAITLAEGIRAGTKYDIPKILKVYEEMQERGKKAVLESREVAENSKQLGETERNLVQAMNFMKHDA